MEIGPLISRRVVAVGPEHSLAEAARRMSSAKTGSAVVSIEDGRPGIITERDLMRAVADGADLEGTRVEDYMTSEAMTASPSWTVREAGRAMLDGGFRHLIVLQDNGSVGGVLSIRDLARTLLEQEQVP
jgi:CBS domain-containing protein